MKKIILLTLIACASFGWIFVSFDREIGLSSNNIIKSDVLGYDLQYRVYLPPGYGKLENLPVLYLTDGQWYISDGELDDLLQKMINKKEIKPVIAVFLDSRDPHKPRNNRRNNQFLCNPKFVSFFERELIPLIDANYKTSATRDDRAIMGLSFGGLNAAYFGLKANKTIGMFGLQSPALHPCPDIYKEYQGSGKLPIDIFMTTGEKNDTEVQSRRLKSILDKKGYSFFYKEVKEEHNWRNWKPLQKDALLYFFGTSG
ncbi:MAG: alpha/beta hydrolase-fold protein [Bacteroidota bacterium]